MVYTRNDARRFTNDYRDGRGVPYGEQIHQLSWPVVQDVPAIAQRSATVSFPKLRAWHGLTYGQLYLHPAKYGKMRQSDHLSFSKSLGVLPHGNLANPKEKVFDRLYLGNRSLASNGGRQPRGRYEMAADLAFKQSDPLASIDLYTTAIAQAPAGNPNLFAYEKRCAALAELARYREALQDAKFILANATPKEKGPALARVRAIVDFMKRMDNFDNGYHQATATLICLLRPREHRQLVESHPATYGRPDTTESIGRGLSASHSTALLLNWDKDGDGKIDMDEFKDGVAALGYKMKQQEKPVFKGNEQRGYI